MKIDFALTASLITATVIGSFVLWSLVRGVALPEWITELHKLALIRHPSTTRTTRLPRRPPLSTHPLWRNVTLKGAITFERYGRATNNVIQTQNMLVAAKRMRRVLLIPSFWVTKTKDESRSTLNWLQVLDLNYMNVYLHPEGKHCPFEDHAAKDPLLRSFLNGRSRKFPAMYRDPAYWHPDCLIRPVFHAGAFCRSCAERVGKKDGLSTNVTLPLSHRKRPKRFTVALSSFIDSEKAIHKEYPNEECLVVDGSTAFNLRHNYGVLLPYRQWVKKAAMALLSHVKPNNDPASPILVAHIRRADWTKYEKGAKLDNHLGQIDAALQGETGVRIRRLLIITDANRSERNKIRRRFPKSTQGCSSRLVDQCRDALSKLAVEQQAGAMSDFFIGTSGSTFTGRIISMRLALYNKPASTFSEVLS
uniref:Uncharacterized protein n=1 Tax=Vitrella brassicaformis TaxID=1169539 RepID=A0A7S1K2X9_9ALVE|mmetsp:Transcript_35990/g.89737  ORF Transcript_35990/g.89737 Transcript_35990/m.89737 type:complete len:420 (+) Transcript_35990:149-1408(+)